MKIKAAIALETGSAFAIEELEIGEPRHDEVLVRIAGAGICHTDLIVRDQVYPPPLPAVLGHEGSGIVEAVGPGVTKVQPGDHVVLTFMSCGQCRNCARGAPAYCLEFIALNLSGGRADGSCGYSRSGERVNGHFFGQSSFATYSLANQRNVVKVPSDVPIELLGPLGCGIQTGAGGTLNALRPEPGSSIAVFGTGSVGMSALMGAVVSGCTTIIGVDINDQRLELARELGATHVVNPLRADPVAEIQKITPTGVDYSVETTASPAVLRQAVDALAVLGVCGVIGAAAFGTEVTLDMPTIMFGRTVRGIIEGDSVPDQFIPALVELYKQGRFPIDKLVRYYSLEEINDACEASAKGDVMKPVLRLI